MNGIIKFFIGNNINLVIDILVNILTKNFGTSDDKKAKIKEIIADIQDIIKK